MRPVQLPNGPSDSTIEPMRSRFLSPGLDAHTVAGWLGLLLAASQPGCFNSEFSEPMQQVIPPPAVQVFDYRVTEVSSGVVLAEGCGAGNIDDKERVYCHDIIFDIPLETEYYVEIGPKRLVEGTLSATQGRDYFCNRQDAKPRLLHNNPTCYEAMRPTQSELLGVTLFDEKGNEYPAETGYMYIDGNPGDIERYRVKSHDHQDVQLRLGGVCGSSDNYSCLVRHQAP